MEPGWDEERDGAPASAPPPEPEIAPEPTPASDPEALPAIVQGPEPEPALVHPSDDPDIEPTSVPATSPFGITVPVPIVSDRELGIGHHGAHAAGDPGPRLGAYVAGTAVLPEPASVTTQSRVTNPAAAVLLWLTLALLLIAALLATVGSLNRGIYSAAGFVEQYLSAIEDGDASAALSMPGVRIAPEDLASAGLPPKSADTLLRSSVLRGPSSVELVSDTNDDEGHHSVTYRVKLGGTTETMTFDVERAGSWGGVFHSWRFATSPISALTVTVLHDDTFTVNGLTLDARAHAAPDAAPSFNNSADYLVLAPALYEFSRSSLQLEAKPQDVTVTKVGTQDVSIDVQPTQAFVDEVQAEINGFLDQCATQKVLQPTGCPFGTVIDDRVISDPVWSIVSYPEVTLTPDDTAFQMPSTQGIAHISVGVQSLYDGEESTVERDEGYSMGATVVIGPDGNLNIQLH
ncbi:MULTISPECIES: hypothetical protein [unclassified Leifsonia]|uniref:hypothetical protein n=1 Tax=unclassified Leifsonia TaxID=2663824 RepID=UPI0006FB0CD6|nr:MULTISPECIES: hypothetical protein [unclassified Leifsonia]KQX05098.1 hypothetical protein ASC59_12815 [Leifsonia sp. Root1293]KRA08730.1 hypothetical protein ASD61_12815 [Leifsonia sp. Root60]